MAHKGKFQSTRRKKLTNLKKQRTKYSSAVEQVINDSDIILEIIDSRFIDDTRNKEIESTINSRDKLLIFVLNKSDLIEKIPEEKLLELKPHVKLSVKKKYGLKNLRQIIKIQAAKVEKPVDPRGKITIGVIGFPNTGKSSIINWMIGKKSTRTGSEAGVTKGIQKLKLTEELQLLDSPGLISRKEYSSSASSKIAQHTKIGGRGYQQTKQPEIVVLELMKEFPGALEKYYKIDAEGDYDSFLKEFGDKFGFLRKGGEADEDRATRKILRDWQEGKIRV